MPYYTRAGDAGKTGICDQNRISKDSVRIAAIGDIDELNAAIGISRAACDDEPIARILEKIQNDLFVLGADIAAPSGSGYQNMRIGNGHTEWMEKEIDRIAAEIGELRTFILPGGCKMAAKLHLARTVCRRAERSINVLAKTDNVSLAVLPYINRLSSLLFVLARLANKRADVKDVEWTE